MISCLVVDDSKVVRKFARRLLEGLNVSVTEACDGQEALDACNLSLPNMILLDWNMPVMDGMEFLKKFRENGAHSDVKVIFCTTENEFSQIQKAIEAGADEYIMKPFDEEMLKDKMIQTGLLQAE